LLRAHADPEAEITITLGATEALYSVIQATVGPADEVIMFDPAYDSYDPAVRLAGARSVRLPLLLPDFRYDWDRVRAAITPRTRLIIINSPHNPACTVTSAADLDALAAAIDGRDILVLSDEVYEHVVFDGRQHCSVLAHAELKGRSFAVFSFGKTLHATGIRVGYCIAPAELTRELRKVHQFNTFSIAHPLQHAIAAYLLQAPEAWQNLSGFFQAKRDRLRGALADSGFTLPAAAGTYFQLLDFTELDDCDDQASPSACSPRPVSQRFRWRRSMQQHRICPWCVCASRSATKHSMQARRACAPSHGGSFEDEEADARQSPAQSGAAAGQSSGRGAHLSERQIRI
jgi:methionine aminotransferase